MKLTFYGHACFGVETDGTHLLFDPYITPNPKASHINLSDVKSDYILLSHGHGDHLADAEALAKQNDATIISNYEIVTWYQNKGLEKAHPLNHGGSWNFDFGRVKYTNAIHTSSFPDGSYAGNPGGFVVSTGEGNFYYSGDTALTYDMKLIAEEFSLNFAVLPIGDNFTMGVDDAVKAAEFCGASHVIGVHYDTFGYIEIDHELAKRKFQNAGIRLTLLDIGETVDL